MRVETVRGAMAVDGLGTTLMHEHVFVLTPDVMQNYRHEWWDEQDRGADAVRQLQALKDAGVDSIVDPTHNPFTRDGIRVENAVPHYVDLPESLLALLRSQVERHPTSRPSTRPRSRRCWSTTPPATSPEARSEPNGSYRDSPHAQPLPASGCSG